MEPEDRWEPWPVEVIPSTGPDSTVIDDPDTLARLTMPVSGPVGFTQGGNPCRSVGKPRRRWPKA